MENFLFCAVEEHWYKMDYSKFAQSSWTFMTEVPIICRANQWTGFYIIRISAMKELKPGALWLYYWFNDFEWENQSIFIIYSFVSKGVNL